MNLSLKNRITISFVTANVVVLTLIFLVFHYLDSLNRKIELATDNPTKNERIKEIVQETKKQMLMVLIIGFLGTIILALVVPGKIALPFKKIKDAMRELRNCNFDVLIYYSQNDEIGEIAEEMNKMIHAFKIFDELRADRISVENRKFDALANMVKSSVLLVNAEGKLIYMNNRLYSLLQVQSENVIGKDINGTPGIPASIAEACALAIKRQSKVENRKITILAKSDEEEDRPRPKEESEPKQETKNPEENKALAPKKIAFEGHATILPIRGKESSRDYYLMIISKDLLG